MAVSGRLPRPCVAQDHAAPVDRLSTTPKSQPRRAKADIRIAVTSEPVLLSLATRLPKFTERPNRRPQSRRDRQLLPFSAYALVQVGAQPMVAIPGPLYDVPKLH